MRKAIFTILLFLTITTLSAQKYERAVGIRLGYTNGIFFDVQNKDLSRYRFMISWRENGNQLTALKYFPHYKLEYLPGFLSLYYGYGLHAGYTKWDQYIQNSEHGYYWEEVSAPVFGLDGLIGISYDFERLPISITCDAKPFFDFWGKKIFNAQPFDIAISAVYSF